MFCTYCNTARIENEAPCPNCGAPSPLLEKSPVRGWGIEEPATAAWGAPMTSTNQQWENEIPQLSFHTPTATPSIMQQDTFQSPPQQKQQSLVPVPYQGNMEVQQGYSPLYSPQMGLVQTIEQMLPALPEEQNATYVPPMYTKPRAIIPRYRVISGLLSFLIVSLLLCSGLGYYGQVSGKFNQMGKIFSGGPPPSITTPLATQLPDPPNHVDKGPAYNIIPSATTASRIDPNNITLQPDHIFKPGQAFYITYSVQRPKTKGTVHIMLYTDNHFFKDLSSQAVNAGDTKNGAATIVYPLQCEGKAEIYWNDQLAQTIYFVVR